MLIEYLGYIKKTTKCLKVYFCSEIVYMNVIYINLVVINISL